MPRAVTRIGVGLAVLTAIRLWLAAVMPLAPDEAYYWVWSRALAPGYLDHPPMIALWIRAGTTLAGASALGVRLLGPIAAAVGSLLLFDAARTLFRDPRAGEIAVLLLNATLMVGVGAVIMTPDTPLLLFWTATLWAGARISGGGAPGWWLAAGLFSGLALDSKYTAAFLPVGLGLYILIASPEWVRRKEPWIGAGLAALLFLPVLFWNASHDWAGFARQGGRVADWRPERAITFLGELLGGQIGLATPGVFVLFTAGVVLAVRLTARTREPGWTLLAAFSVPPALVFLQHAVGDRVQGNWPAIIWPAAAIAAAGLTGPGWRRLIWPSAGVGFGLTVALYAHGLTGWPVIAGDPLARQLSGWQGLAAAVDAVRRTEAADCIAAEPYGLAAELAWTLSPGATVAGFDAHWLSMDLPRAAGEGTRCILIRPERYGSAPDPGAWRDVTRLADISRDNAGVTIERYAVFTARPLVAAARLPVRAASDEIR